MPKPAKLYRHSLEFPRNRLKPFSDFVHQVLHPWIHLCLLPPISSPLVSSSRLALLSDPALILAHRIASSPCTSPSPHQQSISVSLSSPYAQVATTEHQPHPGIPVIHRYLTNSLNPTPCLRINSVKRSSSASPSLNVLTVVVTILHFERTRTINYPNHHQYSIYTSKYPPNTIIPAASLYEVNSLGSWSLLISNQDVSPSHEP